MKLFTSLLLVLLSSSVFSQGFENLQMPRGAWIPNRSLDLMQILLSLPPDDPVTDMRQVQVMVKTLDEVATLAKSGGLATPPRLRLVPGGTGGNAIFDYIQPSIYVPLQMIDPTGVRKHQRFTIPVWAHEFGHAVFFENYERIAPHAGKVYVSFMNKAREALLPTKFDPLFSFLEKIKAQKISGKISILKRNNVSAAAIAAEQMRHDEMIAKAKSLDDERSRLFAAHIPTALNEETDLIEQIEFPMNEFFADVLAILYSENPEAQTEALHFATGSKLRRDKGTDRNFDAVRNPMGWKKSMPHLMLSPTRSWVWKYCFDGPRLRLLAQRGLKGYAARKILEAIGSEIDARYLSRQFEMPIAMANLRLQQSIDRAMVDPVTGKSLCHN